MTLSLPANRCTGRHQRAGRFRVLPLGVFQERHLQKERRGYANLAGDKGQDPDVVGPSRVLLPVAGEPRRRCLRILASATAACDKAIAISYERRRPSERILVDWI